MKPVDVHKRTTLDRYLHFSMMMTRFFARTIMTRTATKCALVVCVLATLFAILFLCIPNYPGDKCELYGEFVSDDAIATDTIVLRDDGTFEQTIIVKATLDVAASNGIWSYDVKSHYVTFASGFLMAHDEPHTLNPSYSNPSLGIVMMPVEYWLGRLFIVMADSWPEWQKVKSAQCKN